MTRKIILAVFFSAIIATNFSFTPARTVAKAPSITGDTRKFIQVCLNAGGCRFCGSVNVTPSTTTLCASASCLGVGAYICLQWANRTNPVTGKEEVDETTIVVSYSSPALKGATDESALKADFIQQVNAQL